MGQDFLSNTELYISSKIDELKKSAVIEDEEFRHIVKVMRHSEGDVINVTDGKGNIYLCEISNIDKKNVYCRIKQKRVYTEEFPNLIFCIPRMKNNDRFEFALEKTIELGITNFVVYQSDRSIAKGEKLERWNKIALSAMKQSLRSFLPKISYRKFLSEILNLEGEKFIFEQNADISFSKFIQSNQFLSEEKKYFIFGPEGGLSEEEFELVQNYRELKLTGNRLRVETAVVAAASIISSNLIEVR